LNGAKSWYDKPLEINSIQKGANMRYAIAGALILSLELFGVSFASAAMPANGNAIVKASSSTDVIQVGGGCGAKRWPNKKTGKCEGAF
jgi:hypothetical protein